MRDAVSCQIGNHFIDRFKSEVNALANNSELSPIEDMFLMALVAIKNIYPSRLPFVIVQPQYEIGKYRADYLLSCGDKSLIIELDGHNFHDRSEKQRRYEKTRDRYFVSNGFQVVHFTGKEITDNPFKPAKECLSLLLDFPLDHFEFGF